MANAFSISEHKLSGPDVEFTASPNHGRVFTAGRADTLVMHFTAGSNMASSVRTLCEPDGVSAHLVIGRDGKVAQLVPFDTIAWHAGASKWKGRSGLNKYSIGIELDNAGQFNQAADGQFVAWFGTRYPAEEVFQSLHSNQRDTSYWHAYTDVQLTATFALCKALCKHYGIREIVGHQDISPGRKVDPGPAFPLDKLRQYVLSERADDEASVPAENQQATRRVIASALNVRKGPGTDYDKAMMPLYRGQAVKVLERKGEWARVEYQTQGWVSSKFLD